MRTISELAALIAAQAPLDGEHDTIVPRVGLIRSSAETEPIHTLYEPSCCIVAQGRKQARIGSETYVYDASHYLIVGIDLPAIGAVIEASARTPYLCLRLELDRQVIGELVEARPFEGKAAAGAALSTATPQIVDACVRLLELIDAPEDVETLAPPSGTRASLSAVARTPGRCGAGDRDGRQPATTDRARRGLHQAALPRGLHRGRPRGGRGDECVVLLRALSRRDGYDGSSVQNADQASGSTAPDDGRWYDRCRGGVPGRVQQPVSVQPRVRAHSSTLSTSRCGPDETAGALRGQMETRVPAEDYI